MGIPQIAAGEPLAVRLGKLADQAGFAAAGAGDYLNPPTRTDLQIVTSKVSRIRSDLAVLEGSVHDVNGRYGDLAITQARKAVDDAVDSLRNGIAAPVDAAVLVLDADAQQAAGSHFRRAQSILDELATMTSANLFGSASVDDVSRAAAALG